MANICGIFEPSDIFIELKKAVIPNWELPPAFNSINISLDLSIPQMLAIRDMVFVKFPPL